MKLLLTLAVALLAALLCVHWKVPLPWMLGPLCSIAALSMLGAPTRSWVPLRNFGQSAIGLSLGLYFVPSMIAQVISFWWLVVVGVVWALVLGAGFERYLRWIHAPAGPLPLPDLQPTTAFFASSIGAASEMTIMAERYGGQDDMVAAAHSLRVMLVVLVVPVCLNWWLQGQALAGIEAAPAAVRSFSPQGLAVLVAISVLSSLAMRKIGSANPWFLGALGASMLLTGFGLHLSTIPSYVANAAMLFIGVNLGVRFQKEFLLKAPKWFVSIGLGTLGLIVLSALLAWAMSVASGLHPFTLLLGMAPGGITEMAVTAKVLHLGVPMVTAFQVTRLAAVLFLTEPLYRWKFGART